MQETYEVCRNGRLAFSNLEAAVRLGVLRRPFLDVCATLQKWNRLRRDIAISGKPRAPEVEVRPLPIRW